MSHVTVQDLCTYLESVAPTSLAEEWDNVGLLVGDSSAQVEKVMTCLTVTPESAAEAVEQQVDLIVTHHPMPFRAAKKLTTDSTVGHLLWNLIRSGVSIYSPHTAFDSAAGGINQQLAERLELINIRPLIPCDDDGDNTLGTGRFGDCAGEATVELIVQRTKEMLQIPGLHLVGNPMADVRRVAVACGSAGQFLEHARQAECDAMLIGETNFHTCLEAQATGVHLILPGHFASERFAVEILADQLAEAFPKLHVWASKRETDPLRWVGP